MSIPEETIEAIRARADIVAVVSPYVALKKRGRHYVGLCPFHAEKTPSFTVSPERGDWHCYGCHQGGTAFHFLMRVDGLTFPEAVERLAAQTGITIQRDPAAAQRRSLREQVFEVNKAAAAFFVQQLGRSRAAQEFLRRRGLSDESIAALGIGYAPADWDALSSTLLRRATPGDLLEKAGLALPRETGGYYDRFRDRVTFPIRDVEGRVLGFGGRILGDGQPKYLNSPETPVFDKGHTLYGLERARRAISDSGVAIVVEGYMDAAMAYQHGLTNVVATLGTALGQGHLEVLRRYGPPRVVLAYDGDAAGAAAAERSLPIFESVEMDGRILILPAGRDPDEFLREQGVDAFQQAVREALPLVEFQLRRLTGRADRSTPEGLAALARAVAPVLAGIRSAVKREEYVRRLAEEWCAGQLHRVNEMEAAIRREVQRGGGLRQEPQRARDAGGPQQPAAAPAGSPAIPPRIVQAEQFVLQGLLSGTVRGDEVFAVVPPEEFQAPAHRRLAEILGQPGSAAEPASVLSTVAAQDSDLASLVSRLHSQQEKLPVTAKMVERYLGKYLWVIKESGMRARIHQLEGRLAAPNVQAEERKTLESELRGLRRQLSALVEAMNSGKTVKEIR